MAQPRSKVPPKSRGREKEAPKRKKPTAEKTEGSLTQKPASEGKPSAKSGAPKGKAKEICFVISPFGGWFDSYYEQVYSPAIEAAGLEPRRADDLYRPSAIVHDIWGLVQKCRVMLGDLTGKNPNVFYELGLAHAVGKPVVLLTQAIEDVPFDLRSLRVIRYTVEDPAWGELLREQIKQAVTEVLDDPKEAILTPFLRETAQKRPEVPADEKRTLEIERELAALRSEVRSLRRRTQTAPQSDGILEPEARDRLDRYMRSGWQPSRVYRRLTDLGAPAWWVEQAISEWIEGHPDMAPSEPNLFD